MQPILHMVTVFNRDVVANWKRNLETENMNKMSHLGHIEEINGKRSSGITFK